MPLQGEEIKKKRKKSNKKMIFKWVKIRKKIEKFLYYLIGKNENLPTKELRDLKTNC